MHIIKFSGHLIHPYQSRVISTICYHCNFHLETFSLAYLTTYFPFYFLNYYPCLYLLSEFIIFWILKDRDPQAQPYSWFMPSIQAMVCSVLDAVITLQWQVPTFYYESNSLDDYIPLPINNIYLSISRTSHKPAFLHLNSILFLLQYYPLVMIPIARTELPSVSWWKLEFSAMILCSASS